LSYANGSWRELDYYKTLKKSFQNPLEILKPIKKHL